MSHPMESLSQALLDEIVSATFLLAPSLRVAFLSSLGSCFHASAVRVLFRTLSLPDDATIYAEGSTTSSSMLYPVLSNPARYASNVKTLVIANPALPDYGTPLDELRPIDTGILRFLLESFFSLEGFIWESPFAPPDGLCETLATHNPRLLRVAFSHPSYLSLRCSLIKWDAPSLPLLSTLPLTSIRVSRLSQAGARALSHLLEQLGEESSLECLDIDFVWLDDPLCEKIARAGRKLKRITLTTPGTKLSDRGIVTILEGCDVLEALVLDEVQGRLSRSLWTKPVSFPSTLKSLRIVVSEIGPHHSWATDHLDSVHALPLTSILSLAIVRREAPPSLHSGVAVHDALVDDTVALKGIPSAFMDRIKQQKYQITDFRCDFWYFTIADVKLLLEQFPKLEHLQLCVDAPFAKLIGLTSNFASLANLRTLSVSITPPHAPGKPPSPMIPISISTSPTSLPTPTESPVLKSKSLLPQLLDMDQIQPCQSKTPGDPSMPLIRDIKRFVRKCPQLEVLDWCGKNGRGSWVVTRPGTSSKSINVSVEYAPPKMTEKVWKAVIRETSIEDVMKRGWGGFAEIERPGCIWTGETAEAFAADRLAAEKDDTTSLVERGKPRESNKRMRVPSVSISSSSGSDVLPLTPTTSPVAPLTPPFSDLSASEDAISPKESLSSIRKRSPSEPKARNKAPSKARTRSTTGNLKVETTGNHQSNTSVSGTGGRGAKQGGVRGGASSSRGTARPSESNAKSTSGRGRNARGSTSESSKAAAM